MVGDDDAFALLGGDLLRQQDRANASLLGPVASTITLTASPRASRLASTTQRCVTLTSSAANRSHSWPLLGTGMSKPVRAPSLALFRSHLTRESRIGGGLSGRAGTGNCRQTQQRQRAAEPEIGGNADVIDNRAAY